MTDSSAHRVASPTFHATCLFTILVFAIILVASCILRVEIVARGTGRVVPSSRVQLIQPEFSGQVTAIHVDNGSKVEAGALLLALDATEAITELETIQAEIGRLETEGNRIALLLDILDKASPSDRASAEAIVERFSVSPTLTDIAFFTEQKKLLGAEAAELRTNLQQLAARIRSNEKSVDVTRANIARMDAALEIQQERLQATETLVSRGTSSRATYLSALEAFTGLQKERDVLLQELDQKAAQTTALQAERRGILTSQRNRSLQRRSEINSRLATLHQQRRAAKRRICASRLTAPVSGTVDQLNVFTIGGVAKSGETLMQVVPDGTEFEIEALFANQDIGFLKVGQDVRIKLDAFPAERFGTVSGIVAQISADAVQSSTGTWGFIIRIKPEFDFLKTPSGRVALKPGMTASIDAITGNRTLISYFLEPISAQLGASLGER